MLFFIQKSYQEFHYSVKKQNFRKYFYIEKCRYRTLPYSYVRKATNIEFYLPSYVEKWKHH